MTRPCENCGLRDCQCDWFGENAEPDYILPGKHRPFAEIVAGLEADAAKIRARTDEMRAKIARAA